MKTEKSALMEAYPYLEERESLDWPAFNCPQSKILELLKDLRDTKDMDFLAVPEEERPDFTPVSVDEASQILQSMVTVEHLKF